MAYNFKKDWVFRAGFAVNTLDLWTNGLQENFEEYLATAVVQPPPGNPDVAFYLSQGPPQTPFTIGSDGTVPFVGTNFTGRNASYYDPNIRSAYILNWNAGFQYQLSSTMVVELTYQGSSGVGLLNRWDINQIPLDISHGLQPARPDPAGGAEFQTLAALRIDLPLQQLRAQQLSLGHDQVREALLAGTHADDLLHPQQGDRRG